MSTNTLSLEVKALCAISQIIDKALDLEQSLQNVLSILSRTMSMKRATITLYDQDSGNLTINTSYGLTPEEKERGVYQLDEGITGMIYQSAAPYVVPDITQEPLFLDRTESRKIEKEKIAFVGVPILLHGQSLGVLNVDRLFEGHIMLDEDVDFLTIVATLISQFISLHEKIKTREADLRRENTSLKYQISREQKKLYIVGKSHSMLDVEQQISRVAPTKATVLLLGESGTGKTLVSRIIHELSERRNHPFIKVNCAAIPDNLLEAELFGYEKGAFTGA
ncbi:MAG: sigma 54-interacting transcriptional regulator, partial [Desulfoplanes sp.]|nr:sigma 54-interacting transcriptional regulator [Desulfoplanes sp.]